MERESRGGHERERRREDVEGLGVARGGRRVSEARARARAQKGIIRILYGRIISDNSQSAYNPQGRKRVQGCARVRPGAPGCPWRRAGGRPGPSRAPPAGGRVRDFGPGANGQPGDVPPANGSLGRAERVVAPLAPPSINSRDYPRQGSVPR
jgi:hypothetical protein